MPIPYNINDSGFLINHKDLYDLIGIYHKFVISRGFMGAMKVPELASNHEETDAKVAYLLKHRLVISQRISHSSIKEVSACKWSQQCLPDLPITRGRSFWFLFSPVNIAL